ncbi:isoprenyl transferase [Rothia aerolata]|uniref:isoprenyl transferase n=1 Tax=Rothia aerolata TaxID=1812262 RepID=UPI0028114433|nr:isoprenyl transferase [Rothia aerolata]
MKLSQPLYSVYEKTLVGSIPADKLPRHVGVLMDGNRRWAAAAGQSTKHGHQAGAERVIEFLSWCKELEIPLVTLYMLSTENLKRKPEELADLLEVIEGLICSLAESQVAKVHPVGQLSQLPESLAASFDRAVTATEGISDLQVNIAVGYGGRQEIVDAVREMILEAVETGADMRSLAENLQITDIDRYLYTRGMPDPDLLIRTSGEQRLSGFMTWQSAYSEFYFCEALWPDFRRVDFLRALRDYAHRQRRFGS